MKTEKSIKIAAIILFATNIVLMVTVVFLFGELSRSTTAQLRELNTITDSIDARLDRLEAEALRAEAQHD